MLATTREASTVSVANGRIRRSGDRPEALMTISSLSLFSLLSV